ncbi:hypothetical protein NL676_031648 [Syzygium grande]|nr:hypothetical protein NL676_031648 [Syzygium grande]
MASDGGARERSILAGPFSRGVIYVSIRFGGQFQFCSLATSKGKCARPRGDGKTKRGIVIPASRVVTTGEGVHTWQETIRAAPSSERPGKGSGSPTQLVVRALFLEGKNHTLTVVAAPPDPIPRSELMAAWDSLDSGSPDNLKEQVFAV